MMKNHFLLFVALVLPLLASASDIEVKNADGVTIYYNYINDGTELSVTFRGTSYSEYSNEYTGNVIIPKEVTFMNKTLKVTSIGNAAFSYCSGLTSVTIPNSVTSIDGGAFFDTGLTSVTIPYSVTSIGVGAFSNCTGLTSVIINSNSILSKKYSTSSSLIDIFGKQVKEYIIGNEVLSIGDYAFCGCTDLNSITIPNSVASIGEYAFWSCIGLTSVTIPNSVTSIGEYAFFYCYSLTSVSIPNSVTSIGIGAFQHCRSLTSVTIPNSVTSIGNYAFYYCKNLASVSIPNSVTSIGEDAFFDCSSLTSVTIPNSVTSIGSGAFYGCSGLTSVSIPNSVTSIDNNAFDYCPGLTSINVDASNPKYDSRDNCNAIIETATNKLITGCKNTVIPNSVTRINDIAFRGCTGLTSVTIPNSVTSIGLWAFLYCSGLTSVTINSNSIVSKNYSTSSSLKDIFGTQVKEYIIGNEVLSIGSYAFSGCSSLTSVTINSNSIVSKNYSTSSSLKDIFGTQVKEYIIGNEVLSIGSYAFSGCTGLTSTTIPNSVTSIGDAAFYGCTSLTSVTIPNSVTSIGDNTFYGCSDLTSVTIPNSVTSIGKFAFYGCTGLTSIEIPNSVTSIGSYAFHNCTGLTSITIPNSVTSIGSNAFSKVDIPTVVSLIEIPFIIRGKSSDYRTFSPNTFDNATLYVPLGTKERYKATKGWEDFVNIVEGRPTGIKSALFDRDKNYPIYDINGRRLGALQRGINIIRGKKVIVK